ncbi:MAG TPA: DUF3300 domain-containing protein [Candidatus Binataceae bacterium]|nr:DUF3300 domain-containing protein [Candidatus Binataceae bacterium]
MITLRRRGCSSLITCCLVTVLWTNGHSFSVAWAQGELPPPPEAVASLPPEAPETPAPLSSDELDQMVAPIALYPDALVAQILAGSTYPTEVVEAARWQSANSGLSGADLAAAVDSTNWDPSIKALTQFPSVLADMNNNLSWTSALGQAYYYQPEDVLNAVQVMRQRALAARTLMNTPQQRYYDQNGMVMIEPVNPNEVYVPNYNPADMYGAPMAVYPGYSTGEMIGAGVLAFGAGVAVGMLASQAWGWHGWNTDWHHHHVTYQNNAYVSNTNTFGSVGSYGGGGYRGGNFNRPPGNSRQGGFNASAGGRPQGAAGGSYRPGAPANPWGNGNRQMTNRGPGERGAPAESHPAVGARPSYKSNAAANPPGNGNRQVANRGPGHSGAPAESHPAVGARPSYKPNAPAPQAMRNKPEPQARQANPYRGFAKTPAPGLNKTAFARIAPGGEAIAASARGRASLGRAPAPARAAPPAHAAARPAPRPAARPAAPANHKH